MQHIEIYGFAQSTYVRTARMVCEEKHLDYQLLPLEFRQDSHRALHPFLRMPVMRVGEVIIYETLAIACYLNSMNTSSPLEPSNPLQRAQMFQWISTCNDYLYPDLVAILLTENGPTQDQLDKARLDLELIDKQLMNEPFLLGKEIYLCDFFLAPMISFASGHPACQEIFLGLDWLQAWKQKLESRTSFKETQP